MNPFYTFRAEAGDEPEAAELLIFDAIGNWEDMGEVSAKAFARDLAKLPTSVKRIDLHINSPGGSVFEASAIYSRLADHKSEKVVYVDGLAASAASIIAMVGHKIYIRANANMMIHLPSGLVMGNADDMRKFASALDSITESMINVYAKKTTLPRDEIRSLMADETWFSPQEALDKGFADELRGVVKAAAMTAMADFDLSKFRNAPALPTSTTKGNTMANKPKVRAAAAVEEPEEETHDENGKGGQDEIPTPPAETPATETPVPPSEEPASEFKKGVTAERARIAALQKLDRPATHAIVAKAIADGKQPIDIISECMDAMDKASKQHGRRVDASNLDLIPASDGGTSGDADYGNVLKNAVKAQLKARGRRSVLQSRS